MSGEIVKRLNELLKDLNEERLTEEGYQFFKRQTPIKTGNARRNTVKRQNEIEANYAYARRLDQGYSKQAPDGMTQPTIKHIQDMIKKESRG